ncbi:MAG: PQQ-binding-like beta-propeller repeat protein [Armatimonadetes bacterium]|nr:PQQ-binding-like beta-propeller repeat protein [Armatimonadota bacterium]
MARLACDLRKAWSLNLLLLACTAAAQPEELAVRILNETGIRGGVIVHVGCGTGELTAALRAKESYIVQGLERDAAKVRAAREHIRDLGLYGPVSVDEWSGGRLPYAENLVNLIVVEATQPPEDAEMLRVLAPNGVAYIREGPTWRKLVKPWPAEIDEWTHFLHGADGNPVAEDTVVGPPKHYQWLNGPLWLRSHDTDSSVSSVVTAKGRLFYIVDEAPISLTGQHDLPDKWSLVALDAFNGMFLWRVRIEGWGWREWKDSWFTDRPDNLPVNLPWRLVAADDCVYVTLGYHAAVSQLDAVTGQVIQTYPGTEDTREILYQDGVLLLSVFEDGRLRLVAIEAKSGKHLWQSAVTYRGSSMEYFPTWRQEPETPVDPALNPATDGRRICLIDGRELVCLDFATGTELWRAQVEDKSTATTVGTVIIKDEVVLHGRRDQLIALSADTGERLWSTPKRDIGWLWFQWEDVFVIDGLVWTWGTDFGQVSFLSQGKTARNNWPLMLNGYNLRTGKIEKQVATGNVYSAPHHHRCYRNKATTRYVITSRRGSEFLDLENGRHSVNNWVRGTCHLGMMPANGIYYAPPHPCVCYIEEKLNGFNALAPEIPQALRPPAGQPGPWLERGPAYDWAQTAQQPAHETDWPTFRGDNMRSGTTEAKVPPDLVDAWTAEIGGKLTAPVVAADKVFVAQVDQHHVVALNARDGSRAWVFAAGARIDSPPTWHDGLLLFGSADGYLYCLRADDGALAWKLRLAPEDRRIGVFGQLESVWPLHGSVLVQQDPEGRELAYVAAGRSSHLDGGIRVLAVDIRTGQPVHERRLDGPETPFEEFKDNLNPAQGALTDIMQGDGVRVYMRGMTFGPDLQPTTGGVQRIRTHSGMLDDTYFKRAFWSFGPGVWGRIMVHDQNTLYLVRMFDSLKMLDPEVYFTPGKEGYLLQAASKHSHSQVSVANSPSLSPANKPLTVEAWVKAEGPDGAVFARGGLNWGYALYLRDGKPCFVTRVADIAYTVTAPEPVGSGWTHLAGVAREGGQLEVWVNGQCAATLPQGKLLSNAPGQASEVGADAGSGVGEYESPFAFRGLIDEVRVYHRALSPEEIAAEYADPGRERPKDPTLVLHFPFEGDAKDVSGHQNHGTSVAAEPVTGKVGRAFRFAGTSGGRWQLRAPVRVQALAKAGDTLFAAGPPDVVPADDPLAAFEGRLGGVLWALQANTGEKRAEYRLSSPPVFNGIAATPGRLYLVDRSGTVRCMQPRG